MRCVRRHVDMPYVQVSRRAHLADGVIERIVGRHRSERGVHVRMIRTLRAEISLGEVEPGQCFTQVLAAVVRRLSVAMILRLENACKATQCRHGFTPRLGIATVAGTCLVRTTPSPLPSPRADGCSGKK